MDYKNVVAGGLFALAVSLPASAGVDKGEFSDIVRPAKVEHASGKVSQPDDMLAAAFVLLLLDHKL